MSSLTYGTSPRARPSRIGPCCPGNLRMRSLIRDHDAVVDVQRRDGEPPDPAMPLAAARAADRGHPFDRNR